MIAIISDLHLQHTSLDGLRYRKEDGEVREVGVRRNVTAGAFNRFAGMIDEAVGRHQAKDVHLVFAGDIFELHRTPLWFMGQDSQVRPYIELSGGGAAVTALRKKIQAIFEQIGSSSVHAAQPGCRRTEEGVTSYKVDAFGQRTGSPGQHRFFDRRRVHHNTAAPQFRSNCF